MNIKSYVILVVFLFAVISIPSKTYGALISASAESAISSGDTSVIDVYLNTEGELINTIDGSIILSDTHNGNFEIRDFSLVGSVFSMWPRSPSLEDGHKVSFIGGVPKGVNGDRLLLFKMIVKINDKGDFTITPKDVVAYLNDGLATLRKINKEVSVISIGTAGSKPENNWQNIISNDNTAPLPFEIKMVQDESLFDGKKFLFFETTDTESGISYYEVREDSYPAVHSGTNYLLINQDKDVEVTVTAYDKAGNFQVAVIGERDSINWMSIVITLLVIIVVRKVIKIIRAKKNKANA